MKIGNIHIKTPLVLAPMSGVTDVAFRLLCKEYGAGLVESEFVSVEGLIRNNYGSHLQTLYSEKERPLSIQIFGHNLESIKQAAKIVETKADILDFNIGCPAYCVVREGSGSALLDKPELIASIAHTLTHTVSIPVTAKIRIGISSSKITAVETATLLEKQGIKAITIHGRTAKQGYSGKSDLSVIKKVRESISIPVIGNGDVVDQESYKKMLEVADAAMVGRAAIGNPHIFREILTGKKQSPKERIGDYFRYLQYCEEFGIASIARLRQQAMYFTTGLDGATILRQNISHAKTKEEIEKIFSAY